LHFFNYFQFPPSYGIFESYRLDKLFDVPDVSSELSNIDAKIMANINLLDIK